MPKKKAPAKVTIEISLKSLFSVIGLLAAMYLLFLLRNILLGLFISILFATALNPLVMLIEKLKLPRTVAIFILYALIMSLLVGITGTLIPVLMSQTTNLIQTLESLDTLVIFNVDFVEKIGGVWDDATFLSSQFESITSLVTSTFSGVVTFFTFAVVTFYLLNERPYLHKHVARLTPTIQSEHKTEAVISKIEYQIGSWVRGQIFLMLLVGLLTYIGLMALKIPFALPLALLAGILEIVPNIGPTVSAIPAILVPLLLGQDPITAVFVLALYILIQQLENNFLVPQVMQSSVGIHPLVTILSIIVGLEVAGVAGAVLAVPIYLVTKVFYLDLIQPYLTKK